MVFWNSTGLELVLVAGFTCIEVESSTYADSRVVLLRNLTLHPTTVNGVGSGHRAVNQVLCDNLSSFIAGCILSPTVVA